MQPSKPTTTFGEGGGSGVKVIVKNHKGQQQHKKQTFSVILAARSTPVGPSFTTIPKISKTNIKEIIWKEAEFQSQEEP
jgi:hypothetical protein